MSGRLAGDACGGVSGDPDGRLYLRVVNQDDLMIGFERS